MRERFTKQGVRDLNTAGHNGNKQCRHWFAGERLVIGSRWAIDPDYLDVYEKSIYGRKCMWCPCIKEL